jgi:hypothetical protein
MNTNKGYQIVIGSHTGDIDRQTFITISGLRSIDIRFYLDAIDSYKAGKFENSLLNEEKLQCYFSMTLSNFTSIHLSSNHAIDFYREIFGVCNFTPNIGKYVGDIRIYKIPVDILDVTNEFIKKE